MGSNIPAKSWGEKAERQRRSVIFFFFGSFFFGLERANEKRTEKKRCSHQTEERS